MGRPISKKYFANTNVVPVGGEGLTGVTIVSSGTNYSAGSTVAFGAPQVPGATTATGTLSVNAAGNVTAVNIVSSGTGYTSTVTFTVTTASNVSIAGTGTSAANSIYVASTSNLYTGMLASGTGVGTGAKITTIGSGVLTMSVVNASTVTGTVSFIDAGAGLSGVVNGLTSIYQNGVRVYAYIPGGSSAVLGDVIKQEASSRYFVRTAQGTGQCSLVTTSTITAGQMYMTALDYTGASYFVKKLTARKAILYRYAVNGGSFQYADGEVARWSFSAATNGIVQIVNN